jgi:hypothetical protein
MGNIVCLAKIGQNWAGQCSRTGDVRLQVETCCEGRTKVNRDRVGHTVLYIKPLETEEKKRNYIFLPII